MIGFLMDSEKVAGLFRGRGVVAFTGDVMFWRYLGFRG